MLHSERPVLPHTSPSVGSITKKVMEINPRLTVHEVIDIVRRSVAPMGGIAGDFHSAEIIDAERALQLARASLAPGRPDGELEQRSEEFRKVYGRN